MATKSIHTDSVAVPITAYSQAVATDNLLFLSGQLAYDSVLDAVPAELDAAGQTERLLGNIVRVLAAAGLGLQHVVKSTIYLTDLGDFMSCNEVYARHFEGMTPPARSTIGVAFLGKGARVEIEMIAALS